MELSINIKNKIVKIALLKNNKAIDNVNFPEANNLSEKLLPAIDKLLGKNMLVPKDIKNVSVRTDTPESFTTSRIARTIGKTWNWATSRKK